MTVSIQFLLYSIIILLSICAELVVYLVIQRKLDDMRQREKELYISKTKELWYTYLLQEGNFVKKLIPRNGCQIEAVEEILLSYNRNIFNKMMHMKIKYFAKAYLANITEMK